MQRSHFIFFLSLISVTFLWLQIFVLKNIKTNKQEVFGFVSSFILKPSTQDKQAPLKDLFLLLQDFFEICSKNQISTFIIDPTVLQSIQLGNISKNTYQHLALDCLYLCRKPLITLGILGSSMKPYGLNQREMSTFGEKEINISVVTGQVPKLMKVGATTSSLIPLHYIFKRHAGIIHLVILYDRGPLGLWHGSIAWNNGLPNFERSWVSKYFHAEGVLNRFSIDFFSADGLTIRLPFEIKKFLQDLQSSRYLPCNTQRAREFYSKYGEDGSDNAGIFRKRAREVLQIARIVLDNLGVQFWLSSGTCLGWFRQCNVISHGKDMDIGIWIKDYKEQLVDEFQNNGLYLEHRFGKVDDSFQMSFKTVDDIKLDIFFFYEEGTYMWNGGTQAKTGKKFKYIFPNFSLCWTEFLGMKVRVPCETESYIAANYGKSWAVPIKNWDWKKSPSNVVENGEWDEKDWPEVIQFFEIE